MKDLKKRSLNFYDIHAKNNAIIQSYYPINIDNIDTKTEWFLTRFYLLIKVLFFDKKNTLFDKNIAIKFNHCE